jgi:Tol biopolymer transport system component
MRRIGQRAAAGGAAKNITESNKAYDGDPEYSPDGKYIAYRTQKIPGYESDLFRIAIYGRKTGETTILTESFDNWVDAFHWAPDQKGC